MSEIEIEILYDPIEEAVGSGLLMDERHDVLPDGDWIQHIRRETGRDNLFVYHHKETEKFVLAGWVYTERDDGVNICVELDTMDLPPDKGGWLPTEYVKARVRPVEEIVGRMKRRMKEGSEAKKAMKMGDAGKKAEVMEYYRKKGDIEMVESLRRSPYIAPSDELVDNLKSTSRNRIITSG